MDNFNPKDWIIPLSGRPTFVNSSVVWDFDRFLSVVSR
jgi:hypothetical protein